MRYHVVASGQMGVVGLKRDSARGAIKKAREFRDDGFYADVRIIDADSGAELDDDTLSRIAATEH